MKSHLYVCLFFLLLLMVTLVFSAQAGDRPRLSLGDDVIHGGNVDNAKAGADTINLMSTHNDPTNGPGEPFYYGDFEDASGNPAWNGWTHWDITQPTVTHWNVSTYNQPDPANHAAWCGDINIPSCGDPDPDGGYGNSWHDLIEFRQTVAFPEVSSTVTVTATLIHDSEPGYDYTYLSYKYNGQPFGDIQTWDGRGDGVAVAGSVSYLPTEYIGGTDVAIYFRFRSDGGWSDEDCSWPTSGACQVDDINVNIVNGAFDADYFEDFEHGGDPEEFGIWSVEFLPGVGDFAKIWTGLHDIDPCVTNSTPQVAFIDDGIVVPGTGGSQCINWCYGPGGYIVNTTGGLAGEAAHLHNAIESPVMDWPDPNSGTGPDDDGITLRFSVFRHEDLSSDAPGTFYNWAIRSADTDGSAGDVQDITAQGWMDRTFVYWGGPDYIRAGDEVTDLMNPGRDEVQVQLAVYEVGWVWGYVGNDGTPAPYYDNVTVKVFPYNGPGMSSREIDRAQDNWPERQSIDYGDLASHSIRFDMANTVAVQGHDVIDPGDSTVLYISPVRAGADFNGDPELHYILDANPVFTPAMRTAGLPDQGSIVGMPAVGASGTPSSRRWAFDLPDTGFLFPGDVLHYYISATDAIGGVGGTDPQTSLLPADTTGFSTGFGDPMGYNSTFTIHALPSIRPDGEGGFEHPGILFLNDFANRGGENEWYTALNNIGLLVGEDYDVYYTNGPSSGVSNGIGGRANHILLTDYDDILYTCGDLGAFTVTNGDFANDGGDDVGVLTNWLDLGGKDIFMTGDELASDLVQSGSATVAFAEQYLGVTVITSDIRSFIGNQMTPLVKVIPGNPVFTGDLQTWIAFGGCYRLNTFDGVEVMGSAERLAEFTDPAGQPGAYDFSAATLNQVGTSRIISMPVDLMFVYTDPAAAGNLLPGRAQLLRDVLAYFGVAGDPQNVSPVPSGITFRTSHYPNPFNPSTTIKYSMPTAGHLKLSIFNVRGQLVRTLIDGVRPAGADQTVVWDGTDNLGSAAASGVYFYEARVKSEVNIGKMTLLK